MAMIDNKTQCFNCKKKKITYPCEGCSQRFCFMDLSEHKQILNDELNHITNEYNEFKQRINEQKQNPQHLQNHSLIKQINLWEIDSIEKIQQNAQECREIFIKYSQTCIDDIEIKFHDLCEQIKQIHEENEFNEMNLDYLRNQLIEITEELNNPSTISIQQDSQSFINEISIIPLEKKHKQILNDELNYITNEYNEFKQRINEQKQNPQHLQNHSLIKQINLWEIDSIKKIQQNAQECREIFIKDSQTCIDDIEMKFHDLSEQIKQIHEENEFNEMNLYYLRNQLIEITEELNNPSKISIQQDPQSFINEISFIPLEKSKFLPNNF
ncbi:unnamed protein product [Adineta steineri]|uniref:B box-type domain-containing protein n=1 Tax=Adineta steineri TaxID=433720 RepID=A0A815HUB9_9BILA|nr:unnamed protein product [Adineta steineri]